MYLIKLVTYSPPCYDITDTDRWAQNGGIKVIFSQLSNVFLFYFIKQDEKSREKLLLIFLLFLIFIHTDRTGNASSVQFTFNE